MNINKKVAVLAGSAAILAVGAFGGSAYATTALSAPKPGNYVLYGCISGSTRTLEHFYTTASGFRGCPSGSLTVAFNSTGPRGATGPSTTGAAGLNVVVVTADGKAGSGLVWCPASHPYVISGGAETGGPLTSSAPIETGPQPYPANAVTPERGVSGWAVETSTLSYVPLVYAICAK
jgi:hypothetical protein